VIADGVILTATLIGWLDRHAGGITAVATLVLAVLTGVYVAVTYLLVREQRRQAERPSLAYRVVEPGLEVRNLGSGRAAGVQLLTGPRSPLPPGIAIDDLGAGIDLAVGEARTWPFKWVGAPPAHVDIPLTLSYMDSDGQKVWLHCFQVRIRGGKAGTSAGLDASRTARGLKRQARKSLPLRKRPRFLLDQRGQPLEAILVDPIVRDSLSADLRGRFENALKWEVDFEASRGQL
jgi:hypothetical protein